MRVAEWRFEPDPQGHGIALVFVPRRRVWQFWLPRELAVTFPRAAAIGFYQAAAKALRRAAVTEEPDTPQAEFEDDVRRSLAALPPALGAQFADKISWGDLARALANMLAMKGYVKR